MVKCDICKEKIEKTFLNKIKGSYIRVNKKRKVICQSCQKKFSIDEIKERLK